MARFPCGPPCRRTFTVVFVLSRRSRSVIKTQFRGRWRAARLHPLRCLKQILILVFLFICFAYIIFVVSSFGIRSYDMDAEYAYRCFKDDSILPKNIVQPNNKPFPSIFVELRLCNKLKKLVNGNTGGDGAVVELLSVARSFCFSHVRFFNIEEKRRFVRFVSIFLSCLCLPNNVKDSIIDEMFRFARSMLADDENAGLEVLPFVVDVAVTILQMPGESEDDAIARAGDGLQKLSGRRN